jgi:hypothetical protein
MKRILSITIILCITLSSCSKIITGTSFKEYDNTINTISIDLLRNGYELVDHNTGTENKSTIIETYSKTGSNTNINGNTNINTLGNINTSGNVNTSGSNKSYTEVTNLVDTYDYYAFSNNKGDIVELNIKYKAREVAKTSYLSSIELLGCRTSNLYDYEKICGDSSVVRRKLEDIKHDLSFEVYDSGATNAAICGVSIIAIIIELIVLFSLE